MEFRSGAPQAIVVVVPSWFVQYAVVLLIGMIVGLMLRFVVAIVLVGVAAVGTIVLLGYVGAPVLSQASGLVVRAAERLGGVAGVLFTVVGLVFVAGVLGGLLLTSPLRAFGRPRFA
jgi:hypothetical protein